MYIENLSHSNRYKIFAKKEDVPGYTNRVRALIGLPYIMTSNDIWGDFVSELVMGYAFMIVVGEYWLMANISKARKNNKGNIN